MGRQLHKKKDKELINNQNNSLEKKNEIINRAIEFIKYRCNYAFTEEDLIVNFLSKEEVAELLSILKGEDKE